MSSKSPKINEVYFFNSNKSRWILTYGTVPKLKNIIEVFIPLSCIFY